MKILVNLNGHMCLTDAFAIMRTVNSQNVEVIKIFNHQHVMPFFCYDGELIVNFDNIIKRNCHDNVIDLSKYKFSYV